jgi:hypothetical protein
MSKQQEKGRVSAKARVYLHLRVMRGQENKAQRYKKLILRVFAMITRFLVCFYQNMRCVDPCMCDLS